MPATSKQMRMLEKVADHYVQRKQAHTLRMATQLLEDLPSLDGQFNTDMTESSSLLSLSSSVAAACIFLTLLVK